MWSPLSPALRDEIRRFRLAFTCEDCAHFDEAGGGCDLFYPTEPHRRAAVEAKADGEPVLFCKMFESS